MFQGLGIDIEALRYMREEDLRILVPDYRLGIRIKLRQRLERAKGLFMNLYGFLVNEAKIDPPLYWFNFRFEFIELTIDKSLQFIVSSRVSSLSLMDFILTMAWTITANY